MADVPGVVQYGKVVGFFTSAIADTIDASTVPDEVPLTGFIFLMPNIDTIRFGGTSPARVIKIQPVRVRVFNGLCYAPGADPTSDPAGVWILSTAQAAGSPDTIQWTASFLLDNIARQLPDVVFEVPISGGTVDISQVMSSEPEPGLVKIVSNEDRAAAEAASAAAIAASAAVPKWWSGTQSAYNAIPTKDASTLYLITG